MTSVSASTLQYWPEDTYPAGFNKVPAAPAGQLLRFTGADLKVSPTLIESPEIAAGGEPIDVVLNRREGGGTLPFLWTYGTYDAFLASLLLNSWTVQANKSISDGSVNVAFTAATRTLTLASGAWVNTPSAGNIIAVRGMGNAYLDNGFEVESATGTTIVLVNDGTDFAGKIGNIANTLGVIIKRSDSISNYADTPAFTTFGMEKKIVRPSATDYIRLMGGMPLSIQMAATGNNAFTGSMAWLFTSESNETSSVDGTPAALNTNPAFNGSRNLKKCRLYNSTLATNTILFPVSTSINVANNAEGVPLMGPEEMFDLNVRQFSARFGIEAVYNGPELSDWHLGNQEGKVDLWQKDDAGNSYLWRLNRAKLIGASRPLPGRGELIKYNLEVNGLGTGGATRMLELHRIPA